MTDDSKKITEDEKSISDKKPIGEKPKLGGSTSAYDDYLNEWSSSSSSKKHYSSKYSHNSYSSKYTPKYTNTSSYWRDRYESYSPLTNSSGNNKHNMEKCLHDVSRVANIYDPNIRIGYISDNHTRNDVTGKSIYLDPTISVSKTIDMGKKIDIYAGEILLGSALRKNYKGNQECNYSIHAKTLQDAGSKQIDVATSALYLSMEMNEAFHTVRSETPGFKDYCYARVDHLLEKNNNSKQLEAEFSKEEVSASAKISALVREIDSFGASPLKCYGDFKGVVSEVMDKIETFKTSEERLDYARTLAKKYFMEEEDGSKLPDGDNLIKGSFNSSLTIGSRSDKKESGEIDKLAKEMSDSQKDGESPSEILKRKVFDGAVRHVCVSFEKPKPFAKWKADYERELQSCQPIIDSIIEKLKFIDTEHMAWEEHSLKSGELDEGGLQKIAMNSDRLFYKKEIFTRPSIQIGLLIDESGSMSNFNHWAADRSNRADKARRLAIGMSNALKQIKGIDLSVFGHSGVNSCIIYDYINPESEENDLSVLMNISAKQQNYDSYAIKAVGERMLEDSSVNYSRKLLFVISDGAPQGFDYYGEETMKHMKSISDWFRQERGLEVYGVGIDNAYSDSQAEQMFGANNNIVLEDFDISKVSNVISTFLENIAQNS